MSIPGLLVQARSLNLANSITPPPTSCAKDSVNQIKAVSTDLRQKATSLLETEKGLQPPGAKLGGISEKHKAHYGWRDVRV